MKIKDIKDQLRQEHDEVKVPDMLTRVKRAPLNKLLSGETPAQAFQKKLAVRLLVTATVLLLAAVVAFMAMLLSPQGSEASPYCCVFVKVEQEDSAALEYALVLGGDGSAHLCLELSGEERQRMDYSSIYTLYTLKATDKASIATICSNHELASQHAQMLYGDLNSSYVALGASGRVTRTVNSNQAKEQLKTLVQNLGGEDSDDIDALIDSLLQLA